MERDEGMSLSLSIEEREKKATKSDSAPVPIYSLDPTFY